MSNPLAILRDPESASAVLSRIRRDVLTALRQPGSATTVGADLGLPRQKVNYHLRALENLGLVEHVEDRQRGGCTERIVRATASHYVIDPAVLGDLEARPESGADRLSSAHLAAVSSRTLSDLAELRERAAQSGKRLPTFSLETAVRFSSPADQSAFLEELSNTVARLLHRYHDEEQEGGRWFRVILGAHPALNRAPGHATPDDSHDTEIPGKEIHVTETQDSAEKEP